MSYTKRYNLTQVLRDGSNLYVDIYEKDYVGSVKQYTATNISLESNSSGDEPLSAIVSSQLKVSFIISEADSASDFPDLLNFDDKKYFVKLYNDTNLLWVGYLFNDYVSLPFITGYVQVDLIAIDGLSFLNYNKFNYITEPNINTTIDIMSLIATILNSLSYPDAISVITSCSYYAQGMFNRTDAVGNEPFSQSYIYLRGINGKTYYDVLDNIIKSFNCRLFQSDGQWQILNINEMYDSTRYYTQYFIYPSLSLGSSGTFDKNITINPYSNGNVHFINASQNKIVRKGYPTLNVNSKLDYPDNYLHNGTFKGLRADPSVAPVSSYILYGWYVYKNGSTSLPLNAIVVDNTSDYNTVELIPPISGGQMYITNIPEPPLSGILYAPYMKGPNFTIALQHRIYDSALSAKLEIKLIRGSNVYYYNTSNTWQTSQTYVTIHQPSTEYSYYWTDYSLNVSMSYPAIPLGYGTSWGGNVVIKIYVENSSEYIKMRNLKITQNPNNNTNILVTRQVGTTLTTTKDVEQPYGSYIEIDNTDIHEKTNNSGVLYNYNGVELKNWYRYGRTESFSLLQMLVARDLSNLLNRNFATLEADLGSFKTSKGLNYLDKVVSINDSVSNALSYNGKKFLINRGNITPYIDEENSLQLIEITDIDNSSTETIKYS
jgi:hypothetical protein